MTGLRQKPEEVIGQLFVGGGMALVTDEEASLVGPDNVGTVTPAVGDEIDKTVVTLTDGHELPGFVRLGPPAQIVIIYVEIKAECAQLLFVKVAIQLSPQLGGVTFA
jgi:hypothetical protein